MIVRVWAQNFSFKKILCSFQVFQSINFILVRTIFLLRDNQNYYQILTFLLFCGIKTLIYERCKKLQQIPIIFSLSKLIWLTKGQQQKPEVSLRIKVLPMLVLPQVDRLNINWSRIIIHYTYNTFRRNMVNHWLNHLQVF